MHDPTTVTGVNSLQYLLKIGFNQMLVEWTVLWELSPLVHLLEEITFAVLEHQIYLVQLGNNVYQSNQVGVVNISQFFQS